MSTHTEIFIALSDAMNAYEQLPSIKDQLAKASYDRDFAKLELSDARHTIDSLRATVCRLEDEILRQAGVIESMSREMGLMRERNDLLDRTLTDVNAVIRNHELARNEAAQAIRLLEADKAALQSRLDDAKGYGTRLAEMLKGFGSAINAAVAVPEVTEDKPFPATDPVGMPAPSLTQLDNPGNSFVVDPSSISVDVAPSVGVEFAPQSIADEVGLPKIEGEFRGYPKEVGNVTHEDVGKNAERPDTKYSDKSFGGLEPKTIMFEEAPMDEPFHDFATAPLIPPSEVKEPTPEPAFSEAYPNLPWWVK